MLLLAPRTLLAAACAGLLPLLAAAAAAPPAVEVDRELQALKNDTIELSRELQAIERSMLYPEQTLTSIYVSVKVSGFLLDSLTVRVNEAQPHSHTYTNSESLALLKEGGGWHRLARLRLEPGAYRLQAEFSGHFFDAKSGEPAVKGRVETVFEKGLSELDLVLPISRNSRLDKPGLAELSRIDAAKSRPSRNVWMPQPERLESVLTPEKIGGPNDPRFRTAVFLKHDSRYLSALVELSDILQTAPQPDALPGPLQLLMADCYLGFGMDSKAGARYQKIASGPHDSLTLARARLQLARFDYQHGRMADTVERLRAMQDRLPTALRDEWSQLLTNALLAQERYGDAVTLLEEEGVRGSSSALRYNLAVALIRNGKVAEGRAELDEVGTMDVTNLEQLVLRDKANLTLGYQHLQQQQGRAARTVFGRLRTIGPFSNRALLGLGWAEIAQEPVGKDQEAAAPGDAPAAPTAGPATDGGDDSLGKMLRPGYATPAGGARLGVEGNAAAPSTLPQAEQDALRRALVAWTELVKRDPMDPAVQEGMLAIPWALDRLQAYEQSLTHYLNAITALEAARKRMDDALKSIHGGRMVETIVRRDMDSERGWMWRLRDLPDAAETYFLQSLLAEHRFQESLKSYRDARLLSRHLDAWKKRVGELERGGPGGSIQAQLTHLRSGWQPAWAGTVVWLDLATTLGSPGAFDAPLSDAVQTPMELRATHAPATFEGRSEKLKPLRLRVDALRPRINGIATAQDDLLEAISAKELEGQRATIERYLTEARFAVARIYDRQSQQGAP